MRVEILWRDMLADALVLLQQRFPQHTIRSFEERADLVEAEILAQPQWGLGGTT